MMSLAGFGLCFHHVIFSKPEVTIFARMVSALNYQLMRANFVCNTAI